MTQLSKKETSCPDCVYLQKNDGSNCIAGGTHNWSETPDPDCGHRNLPESTTEDWEIAFEKKFEEHPEEEIVYTSLRKIKSFIRQQIEKARQEGKVEMWEKFEAILSEPRKEAFAELKDSVRKSERTRIIKAIDKLVADKGKLAKVEDVLEIVWDK